MANNPRSPTQYLAPVFDRGPTPYFHGRTQILNNFERLLEDFARKKSGTVIVIQGAPGVGKTALLHECKKCAWANRWEIANIGIGALWDPDNLLNSLGYEKRYTRTERSARLGIRWGGWGWKSARPKPNVKNILKNGIPPLLLIVDEAQALADQNVPSKDNKATAIEVLEAIHNGRLNRPVVLLAGGLRTTLKGFDSLKVSRFAEDCYVELGALSKESERAVIHDWIVKEGGAKGDPTQWIDTIARETHGWPRHVHSYAKCASNQLKEDSGIMTTDGLDAIIESGRKGRIQYYKQRINKFHGDELQCLLDSIADVSSKASTSRLTIMSALTQIYDKEEAEVLFDKFIEKGIIEQDGDGYVIPIPSMHTWLKDTYARKMPRQNQSKHPLG